MKKQIILILIISSFGLKAETKTFSTITDAINYSGADKSFITKLVISDDISGNDYFPDSGSEWGKIRILDEWYPSIEALELLTSQDMPEFIDVVYKENGQTILAQYALFYAEENDTTIYQYVNKSAQWLKSFSAPNIKYIGEMAFAITENLREVHLPKLLETANHAFAFSGLETVEFPELRILTYNTFYCSKIVNIKADKVTEIGSDCFYRCYFLLEADFPAVTTIWSGAFDLCSNMVTANFPKVRSIGYWGFNSCHSLTSLSIGTDFTEPTEIELAMAIWGQHQYVVKTEFIELTLGNVLPKPNLNANTWHYYYDWGVPKPHIWKIIHTVGIEEIIKDVLVEVYPNPATEYTALNFSLEKPCYLEIDLFDITGNKVKSIYNNFVETELFIKKIDVDNLVNGVYFIKISIDKDFIIKKIIVN